MGIFDKFNSLVLSYFKQDADLSGARFIQYIHNSLNTNVKSHCLNCISNDKRIFENDGKQAPIGEENHPRCHCYYEKVESLLAGNISLKGEFAPDVYLKKYGKLPDYYITKQEAAEKYGWNSRRNTLAGKAPGKMIGGDVFKNIPPLLPQKNGRIWYECDVDYISGNRGTCSRLYYSNDGLMFYTDHFKNKPYQII
ncbi:MAG: hypothetical protein IKJ33_02560 [Clostridia bacterium]|nr:hypothetical protein [Clostridia bacterium]